VVYWNHGMDYDFPIKNGNFIIPSEELHHFSEGEVETNNQVIFYLLQDDS
jgi:hypothetical protein